MNSLNKYLELGNIAYENGSFAEAEAYFQQAKGCAENDLRVYEGLIRVFIAAGRDREAVECFEVVCKLKKDHGIENYEIMANYLLRKGDNVGVEKILQLAVEAYPNNREIYKVLLEFFKNTGQHDKYNAIYVKLHELIYNMSLILMEASLASIPEGAIIAYFGHLGYMKGMSLLVQSNRHDTAFRTFLDVNHELLEDSLDRCVRLAQYSEYCQDVNCIIVGGTSIVHAVDMIRVLVEMGIVPSKTVTLLVAPEMEKYRVLADSSRFIKYFFGDFVEKFPLHNSPDLFDYLAYISRFGIPDIEMQVKYLLTYLAEKKARILVLDIDTLEKIDGRSEYEERLLAMNTKDAAFTLYARDENGEFVFKEIIDQIFTNTIYRDDTGDRVGKSNFYTVQTSMGHGCVDVNSKYQNCVNGYRVTTDNPSKYENTLYFVGNSRFLATSCADEHTIPSYVQRLINETFEVTGSYKVLNYSYIGSSIFEKLVYILSLDIKAGDIFVLNTIAFESNKISRAMLQELVGKNTNFLHIDLSHQQRKNCSNEIFADKQHYTFEGNQLIAEQLYAYLFTDNFVEHIGLSDCPGVLPDKTRSIIAELMALARVGLKNEFLREVQPGLNDYLEYLMNLGLADCEKGSIVMNCNPFTFGHQYLIEYAAAQVEHLVIFVVEEDKSFFKFADRIELIRLGTAHIPNVTVVNSGSFIISTVTFPDYFNKEDSAEIRIDASSDLNTYGRFIAPALNIKQRFVGEEPNCRVTKQYNEQMKLILPEYGIELIEIPRKEFADKPISASLVRRYLKEKNIDKIREIVPETTLNFLCAQYL